MTWGLNFCFFFFGGGSGSKLGKTARYLGSIYKISFRHIFTLYIYTVAILAQAILELCELLTGALQKTQSYRLHRLCVNLSWLRNNLFNLDCLNGSPGWCVGWPVFWCWSSSLFLEWRYDEFVHGSLSTCKPCWWCKSHHAGPDVLIEAWSHVDHHDPRTSVEGESCVRSGHLYCWLRWLLEKPMLVRTWWRSVLEANVSLHHAPLTWWRDCRFQRLTSSRWWLVGLYYSRGGQSSITSPIHHFCDLAANVCGSAQTTNASQAPLSWTSWLTGRGRTTQGTANVPGLGSLFGMPAANANDANVRVRYSSMISDGTFAGLCGFEETVLCDFEPFNPNNGEGSMGCREVYRWLEARTRSCGIEAVAPAIRQLRNPNCNNTRRQVSYWRRFTLDGRRIWFDLSFARVAVFSWRASSDPLQVTFDVLRPILYPAVLIRDLDFCLDDVLTIASGGEEGVACLHLGDSNDEVLTRFLGGTLCLLEHVAVRWNVGDGRVRSLRVLPNGKIYLQRSGRSCPQWCDYLHRPHLLWH